MNGQIQIAEYVPLVQQLAELEKLDAGLSFEYETPKGNKDARSHVYKLRQSKSAIDKARKEAKATALEYGRRVDAEAKALTDGVEKMIARHDAPLREIEERETARVAEIRARINLLIEYAVVAELGGAALRARLQRAKDIAIDDTFAEFIGEAAKAKDAALSAIESAIVATEKAEAEKAELERLRLAEADRQQKERELQIAIEAANKATQTAAAESQRREAEQKANAERERLQLVAEKEAAERREAEAKLQAERAARVERERIEAEQAAEAAAEAKRIENKKLREKTHAAIVKKLAPFMNEVAARNLIAAVDGGDIPQLKIVY